jgi:hypothetical protein
MTRFVGVHCSNVAYHGELEKKAAMEQKRVMSGENGELVADGEFQKLQNFIPALQNTKEPGFTIRKSLKGTLLYFVFNRFASLKVCFVFTVLFSLYYYFLMHLEDEMRYM